MNVDVWLRVLESLGVSPALRIFFAVTTTGRLGTGVRVLVLSIERSGGADAAPFLHRRVPARDVQATAMAIAELPVVEDRDLPS